MTPETMFDWYLDKAKHTIEMSVEKNQNKPVILCGHSAGGWLGRALIGNGTNKNGESETTYQYFSPIFYPTICKIIINV